MKTTVRRRGDVATSFKGGILPEEDWMTKYAYKIVS